MKKFFFLSFLFSFSALAMTPGAPGTSIVGFSNNGTPTIVSPTYPLPVTGTLSVTGSTVNVNQGTPGPTSSPWPVTVISPKTPINPNGNLSARQTVTSSESNLAAPSAAVSVIVECESVNVDNLRIGFSNSSTNILSSTLGILCEPGRSFDNIPIGQGSVLHMISNGIGADYASIQWVLSQ